MTLAHDPLADPLTPFWRQKVETAFYCTPSGPAPSDPGPSLTDLERLSMLLLALGYTGARIARWRGIHRSGVYAARDSALRKLEARA